MLKSSSFLFGKQKLLFFILPLVLRKEMCEHSANVLLFNYTTRNEVKQVYMRVRKQF